MNYRGRAAAALVAVATMVAACTTTSAGEPSPGGGVSTPGSTSSSSKPTRPRDLRLDEKDPCALVPEADRTKFYMERPGKSGHNEAYKSPQCSYSTDVGGFRIVLVVTEGIGKWTDGSRIAETRGVAPVAGFPALSITVPADKYGCDVAIDVTDGQYLLASASVDTRMESQVPDRCEYAHQLAESAMSTLVGS